MAEYRRNEIVSGLFVCLAIAVFCLFAFKVGGFNLFGFLKKRALVCRAYFTDVKTVETGAEVKVGGQPVGKVTAVRMVERPLTKEQVDQLRAFNPEKASSGLEPGMLRQLVELELELYDPALRIHPQSARVRLNQGSLLSAHFLDLDPGEWRSGAEVHTIFDTSFAGEVVIATKEGTGFEEVVALVRPVVRQLETTLKTINERLLHPENTGRVGRILSDVETTVANTRDFVAKVSALFDREKDPRLQTMIDKLSETSVRLEDRLEALQKDLHGVLASTDSILKENRAEIAETARRLSRAVFQAEMALRKIRSNPAVILFGDK